ncbi:GerAB/ArcD/ProY family transporter [Paenibacillus chitinolyticus]|uniref:GerAB/ArcD/ProY family transporter n=1 Tax=Paenibacillus chitinolyticus TaxID=79263 RepID=UPI0036D7AC14
MKIEPKDTISQGQLFLLIIKLQIGVGILSLPYRLHQLAKGGGWISVLIAGVFLQLILVMMWMLMKRFPSYSVFRIASAITGRYAGALIGAAYVAYFLLVGGVVMMGAFDIINRWILQNTPRWAVLFLFMLTGVYLIRGTFRTITRIFILFTFLIGPMMFLIGYGVHRANLLYLLPLNEAGIWNIVLSSKETITAMYGFELILIIYPFVKGNHAGKLKAVSAGTWFVVLFYAFTVFTCMTVFSPQQLNMIPEPVMYLLRSLPFGAMDRADLLFLPIWMISMVASMTGYCYAAAFGIGHLLKHKDHKKAAPFAVIISCIIAYLPQTKEQFELFSYIADASAYFFLIGFPVLLLLLSYALKKKEGDPA